MEDDWNLKKYEAYISFMKIEEDELKTTGIYCRQEDIEILRQKLISDLDDRTLGISFKITGEPNECFNIHINLIKEQIVDIINRRFGVNK